MSSFIWFNMVDVLFYEKNGFWVFMVYLMVFHMRKEKPPWLLKGN